MAISPYGDYTAAASKEQSEKISIYATSNFELVHELSIPATDWPELMFSPSGRAVAVRTLTTTDAKSSIGIRIWNLKNGDELYSGVPDNEYNQEFDQNDMITSFEVSRDGKMIYFGTQFGTVNIMSAETGKIEKSFGPLTWSNHNLTENPGWGHLLRYPGYGEKCPVGTG